MTYTTSNEIISASPRRFRQLDWETVGRYLSGELSAEDREVVRRLLAEEPADDALVRLVDDVIQRRASLPLHHIDVQGALRRARARRAEPTPPRSVLRRTMELVAIDPGPAGGFGGRRTLFPRGVDRTMAVSLLALTLVGVGAFVVWRRTPADQDAPHTEAPTVPLVMTQSHMTTTGQRDSVALPDGSLAYLGPVSDLRVSPGFGTEDRHVQMAGEAFFDVATGTRPFVVAAGNARIQVVGTAFTVRTLDSVRVAVTSGSVILRNVAAESDSGVTLGPGDVGVVAGVAPAIAHNGAGTADDLAWLTGRVVFRDAPIEQVVKALKRWYGITLLIPDSAAAARTFYGEFETAVESADVVVRRVAESLGLEIQFRTDTAVLTPAPGPSPS